MMSVAACVERPTVQTYDTYVFQLPGDGEGSSTTVGAPYGYSRGSWADGTTSPDFPPPTPCNEVIFQYSHDAAERVWLTGSFAAWAPDLERGAIELEKDSETGLWQSTVSFEGDQEGQHFYLFIVDGNKWVPDPENDISVPDHLGGSYSVVNVCGAAPGAECSVVHFRINNPSAEFVQLAGSFTNWAEEPLNLEKVEGIWHRTLTLSEARYSYKYVVDGAWIPDPENARTEDDGFGGVNSVVNVRCGGTCGDLAVFDWRDAILYFAMIDRFYDSDGKASPVNGASGPDGFGSSAQYEGGDIAGVEEKLGYLVDLGVTALWLTAPYDNRDAAGMGMSVEDPHQYSAYHGYWPSPANTDYGQEPPVPLPLVEARIGDAAQLESLVTAAHESESANGHGVKVLLDYVMNHVDIDSGLYAAHPEWFYPTTEEYLCGNKGWGIDCTFTTYLPAFDFDNDEARAWSVADAMWWAKRFDLDGYRLDAIKHVPMAWLTDLRAALNDEIDSPDGDRFYLVGETYTWNEYNVLARYVNPSTKLDGQFDFPWRKAVCEATMANGSFADLNTFLTTNDSRYGQGAIMSTFLGNHDIPRVIHAGNGQLGDYPCTQGSWLGIAWTPEFAQPIVEAPYRKLGLGFAVMMTNPGVPLIYYGDEIGLAGGGDPDNRRMMPWKESDLNQYQVDLRSRIRALANIRSENRALSRGSRTTISSSQDTWVYRMGGCGSEAPDVIVAVNKGNEATTVTVPESNTVDLLDESAATGAEIEVKAMDYRLLRVVPVEE